LNPANLIDLRRILGRFLGQIKFAILLWLLAYSTQYKHLAKPLIDIYERIIQWIKKVTENDGN
jgi:hypothetical protein